MRILFLVSVALGLAMGSSELPPYFFSSSADLGGFNELIKHPLLNE